MICALRKLTLLNNVTSKRCFSLITRKRLMSDIRVVSSQTKDPKNPVLETFEEKNERLKRPLSPHLTIYKLQLTSTLSILHRVSGVALVGYTLFIGSFALWDVQKIVFFIQSLNLSAATLYSIKTIIAIPIAYHIANGMRHLFWDVGLFLTNKGVIVTGYVVLVVTFLLSIYLAFN